MGLQVAMRADASTVMGAGHVSRCLTIAEAIVARGGRVRMLGRAMPAHLRAWIEASGHEFVALESPPEPASELAHGAWLGTSQAADARDVVAALDDSRWDWMVVDHYALDARWQGVVRTAVSRMLAVDDLADRRQDVEILLDQNLPGDSERYRRHVPDTCALLLGPSYALVRESFRIARRTARPRRGAVTRVLVFVGGGDADNYTSRAILACRASGLGAGQVDVVIGASHPHLRAVRTQCDEAAYRCHVQTSDMARLMADADFAIGASGSASWERCALGLPTLTFATAPNQEPILAGLVARGAVIALPTGVPVTVETLAEALCVVRTSPARVRAVSEAAWQLVDGAGPARVCDAMEAA
ncbi:MAG: UDP-2,4-diacetamido-2,4,6-trideoxy-beta-L-altropyranose hydrolase [Vicinamibacterales bacterium]